MLSALLIVIEYVCEAVAPDWSVAVTVKLVVPAVVGSPLITPVVLRVKPAGNELPDARAKVSVPVPPVAASVVL
jgi:hypothetical protein